MNKISYQQARVAGLPRYFTGVPCKRGHVAERFTAQRACVVCGNVQAVQWGRDNRALVSARAVQRYADDTAAHQAKFHLWRARRLKRAPAWLTEHDLLVMECRYAVALMLTRVNGVPWSVDHVLPYRGKRVSGFHVPNNLQWLPLEANQRKTNAFDPGGAL